MGSLCAKPGVERPKVRRREPKIRCQPTTAGRARWQRFAKNLRGVAKALRAIRNMAGTKTELKWASPKRRKLIIQPAASEMAEVRVGQMVVGTLSKTLSAALSSCGQELSCGVSCDGAVSSGAMFKTGLAPNSPLRPQRTWNGDCFAAPTSTRLRLGQCRSTSRKYCRR